MKVTILGCGSSGGVPLIGNIWGHCDPANPRNRRRRASILVEEGDITLLIDTSPDVREQLLSCNLQTLSAAIYTHAHADHCHGIDDLRSVNWLVKKPIPVYGHAEVLDDLQQRFSYVFPDKNGELKKFYKPALEPIEITGRFSIGPINITPIHQDHGVKDSWGFRFNDFVYSSDVKRLDDAAFDVIGGAKVWVVDAIRERVHETHSHLDQTLSWIERAKPDRAYLTHMDHTMDYETLCAKLPANIQPAFDGLVIDL